MYNDRNRQNFHSARQFPTAARVGGDLPMLDADQGGRRCDGSSPDRATHDQVTLDRTPCNNRSGDRTPCNNRSNDRTPCNNRSGYGKADGDGKSWGLHEHPHAMVYSPYQHFRDIYTHDVALDRGTLFSELDLPFEGSNNKRNGGCAR